MTEWRLDTLIDESTFTEAQFLAVVDELFKAKAVPLRPWPMGPKEIAWWEAHPDLKQQVFK